MLKFWKKALLVNLAVILAIVASLAIFFATPWGRPALKTMLLVPEVVPNFPVKPLKLFSKKPKIEEVSLKVDGREVKANLYRLPDNKKHPAVVFILGILYSKDNPNVTSTAEILSRSGFVVLVPDLPDFQSGFVWIDSVNTLISSVEFLDKQNFVDQKKIGFAGFCVGASAAIIAAEDERIANKVNFIAAISPYFDLYSTVDAIRGRQIIDDDGSLQSWEPAGLTIETFYKGFINYIADEKERALLTRYFLEEDTDTLEILLKNEIWSWTSFTDFESAPFDYVFIDGKLTKTKSISKKADKLTIIFEDTLKQGQEVSLFVSSKYGLFANELISVEIED